MLTFCAGIHLQNCAIPQTFWTGWRLLNLPGTLLHKKRNSRARSYDINDLLRFVLSWFIRKSFSSYTTVLCVRSLPCFISFKSIGEQISKFYVILTKLKPIMFPHNSIVNYFSMVWIKTLNFFSISRAKNPPGLYTLGEMFTGLHISSKISPGYVVLVGQNSPG
jgi:hypothetical protein